MRCKMQTTLSREYQDTVKRLVDIGCICQGSIGKVFTRCGNDYCPCARDPNAKHGPYWLWTRKENGKTVSKRLDKKQVAMVKTFIKNHENLKKIIAKMKTLSEKAIFQE